MEKCAAGIAGGATTGATTVGLAGASVGTVTLPLVGTVGGGVVVLSAVVSVAA